MSGEWTNQLYFGDNLDILREYIPDESVDLIYLDPPFNSSATYNILFAEKSGEQSAAQIAAFEDTWHWGQDSEYAYFDVVGQGPPKIGKLLSSLREFLGNNDMMAYLTMMAIRLVELHRVLKPTGSMYLHCDPTASHYLKLLMDAAFGIRNFRNEISWKRTTAKSDYAQGATHFPRLRDIILYYRKDVREDGVYNQLFAPYPEEYVQDKYRYTDPDGRHYRFDNLTGPGGQAKGNPSYEVMGVTRYWRYSQERMKQLIEEGRIVQTRPGAVPQYKRYLDRIGIFIFRLP